MNIRLRFPVRGVVWLASLFSASTAFAGPSGQHIYQERCASCHGISGEGVPKKFPHPLIGKRSAAQLTRYIGRSMPKDHPGTLGDADVKTVSAYVFDAFYSAAAQARRPPVRVELARLTVRQYRQTLADLISSDSSSHWDGKRGLQGEYGKTQALWRGIAFRRLDAEVHFDFGTSSPDAKKIKPDEYAIRWQGGVLAPETGEYDFVVRTEQATRLWVNDLKHPLIDAWVMSGEDREHRGTIFLLGGRVYPLRLEFSKGKQGVRDKKKLPTRKATISLEWKPPHRAIGVIPSRALSPNRFPAVYVAATPFPPDDRSVGYERGTSISRAWDQATTDAAIDAADYVAAHLAELAGTRGDEPSTSPRVRSFCLRFAERAFRRPLTPELEHLYVDRQLAAGHDVQTAVKRVVLLVLKSPRFLYLDLGDQHDGYAVASHLSYGLWDSLPDPELLRVARAGQLVTPEQIQRQAERMLPDLRTRSKLHDFFLQWLKVDQVTELSKDPAKYPGFDQSVAADLRTSLELFLDDVVWNGASDFRQLLLSNQLYLNGRLARFYGGGLKPDAPFQKVTLPPAERLGVLSHPYLLATFAYTASSSPIHRGVFLARNVLGVTLRPPPQAFTPLPASMHPDLTTRERVALQTRPQQCQACHGIINPLGFTLENFDAIGRFRTSDGNRPIDASGSYVTRSGRVVRFSGLRDLATFLAGSDEVHEAFIEHLFHYLVKQPTQAYGLNKLTDLRRAFDDHKYSVRDLVVSIVTSTVPGKLPVAKREN